MPTTWGDHVRDLCPAASFMMYRPLSGLKAPSLAGANKPSMLLYSSMAPAWDVRGGGATKKKTQTNCWNAATVSLGLRQSSHAKGETQSVTAELSTITSVFSMTVSSSYLSHVDEQCSNPLVSSFHPLIHSAGFALGLLLQSGRKSNIRIEQINGHVCACCATFDSFNSFASIILRSNSFLIADRSLCQAN